jgi:hypothetical protein
MTEQPLALALLYECRLHTGVLEHIEPLSLSHSIHTVRHSLRIENPLSAGLFQSGDIVSSSTAYAQTQFLSDQKGMSATQIHSLLLSFSQGQATRSGHWL